MDRQKHIDAYANLIIKTGLNVQAGQSVVINTQVDLADFTRIVAKKAYEAGAGEVHVIWRDELISKYNYQYQSMESLASFRPWQADRLNAYAEEGACFLSLTGPDPNALDGVDPEKIQCAARANSTGLKAYYEKLMADEIAWCVAAAPSSKWAQALFPSLEEEEAMDKLWDAILTATRTKDDDPIRSTQEAHKDLQAKAEKLTALKLDYLHITNDLGTDLLVGLPRKHIWAGGPSKTKDGIIFAPNIPTEEVYTAPDRNRVEGIVYSSKPLNYSGKLIENFYFIFKEGRVVDYGAKTNEDALKSLLDIDDGSKYLGEVALVPFSSPINQSGILFKMTLFDENAACHLALGEAYPSCLENGVKMTKEDLLKHGLNDSLSHEDFMFGEKTTKVKGYTKDGHEYDIFIDGTWADF